MQMKYFPTIDPEATGRHIAQLRRERGLSVKDLQVYFGFDAPQAIYKWQTGATLPSVDNLLALSVLLGGLHGHHSGHRLPKERAPYRSGAGGLCFFALFRPSSIKNRPGGAENKGSGG